MNWIIDFLIVFIALEHLFFLVFEMFLWDTLGKKIFRGALPAELFKPTRTLAANQGLYNGFLAAGLIWSLFITNPEWNFNVACFFLTCVSIAGIYGAFSASKKIFFVQALPALITLALLWI
jgi:putative membrane protein